jgi:hypothetical protein
MEPNSLCGAAAVKKTAHQMRLARIHHLSTVSTGAVPNAIMQTIPATIEQHHKRTKVALTPRIEAFIDSMVLDGLNARDAALLHGIRVKRAHWLLTVPAVVRRYKQQMQVLRESAAARGIIAASAIVEAVLDKGSLREGVTAAERKAALDAWKALEGQSSGQGTTLNVGAGSSVVVAGYVVKLDGPAAAPAIGNRTAFDAKPLIEHAPVERDDG